MFERVREIILEYADVEKDAVKPESQFMSDITMNSLDIMTMVGQIEDEFDITVETEDLDTIYTVQDLVDYINERI